MNDRLRPKIIQQNQNLRQINETIKNITMKVARNGIKLPNERRQRNVNSYKTITAIHLDNDPNKEFHLSPEHFSQTNGAHLNVAGYAVIAAMIRRIMN